MGEDVIVRRTPGFTGGEHELVVSTPAPSFASVSKAINRLVTERDGQWCGFPMPLPGLGLHLADGHPHAAQVAEVQRIVDGGAPPTLDFACSDDDLGWAIVNEWRGSNTDGVPGRVLVLRHTDGRVQAGFVPSAPRRNRFVFGPFDTMDAWDLDAELTAVERLATLLSARMFKAYVVTGQFLETSKRSGVTYIFRRLRPTIAMRAGRSAAEFFADDPGSGAATILACLCLHPLAYYERTFCGAMVPTDDVIAHLLLMRGDEHLYWRRANQHHPSDPESGL